MQVSSVGGASQQLLAAQQKRYADHAALVRQVFEVDKQAVSKAQVAVNRSDVLYL